MGHFVILANRAAGGVLAFGLALLPLAASAAPLNKDACAKVAQDIQDMKALDVGKLMQNGPAWAVSNLSPADLNLVRRYIDLDEEMKFRCSDPNSLVHLKPADVEEEGTPKSAADTIDGAQKEKSGKREEAKPKATHKAAASEKKAKPKPQPRAIGSQ